MGHTDEAKMDDLKRLLRRLDGLDSSKVASKTAQDIEAEQHSYVGALRGAPVVIEDGVAPVAAAVPEQRKETSYSAIYVAAATAALISTVTVYLMMSWQGGSAGQGAGPVQSPEKFVPSKLEYQAPAVPNGGSQQPGSTNPVDGLVRKAEQLLDAGNVEAARALLQQAAELGSGSAALKLGRSYDPKQPETVRLAENQTDPALAKAWYQRALALGTREAAGYITEPAAR